MSEYLENNVPSDEGAFITMGEVEDAFAALSEEQLAVCEFFIGFCRLIATFTDILF